MKKVGFLIVVAFIFSSFKVFAQRDSIYKDGRLVMVINRKMVEDFYRNYDKIQVIPWKEILLTKNYSDVKLYYQAYMSLNQDSIAKNNIDIKIALDNKVNQYKNELKNDNSGRFSKKKNEIIEDKKIYLTQNNSSGYNANRK